MPRELGVDERRDVDSVDDEVVDLAVDASIDQFDAAHHDAAHVDAAQPRLAQVDRTQLGTAQVDPLEL
jgi:hypothetical protein